MQFPPTLVKAVGGFSREFFEFYTHILPVRVYFQLTFIIYSFRFYHDFLLAKRVCAQFACLLFFLRTSGELVQLVRTSVSKTECRGFESFTSC